MHQRIVGIDVARALAVFGMIIVNFKVVLGENGNGWLKSFAAVFDGKAAATFVVLAGIGLALMTNKAVTNQDIEKLNVARKRVVKRALVLFTIGISYIWIWPADILHYYGIYMLLTLPFINKSARTILTAACITVLLHPILTLIFNYDTGWNLSALEYVDFWTINGFFRNLFYNGFHPVVPWTAFMLYGLWYGKQDLHNEKFLRRSMLIGLLVFISIHALQNTLVWILPRVGIPPNDRMYDFIGTQPMPPTLFYMINGISIATSVISSCILAAKRFETNRAIKTLYKTGKLALTFYVAHVIIGMGLIEDFGPLALGEYPIRFSLGYAIGFSICCMLFAEFWLRHKKSGPLEWAMRKLTS